MHPVLSWTPIPRVDGARLGRERSHSAPAGGPKKIIQPEKAIDLTLRVTTVTRSARDSPRVVARPPDTPFAAPCIAYSRVDVFQGLEELYAMGGRMRELACMFGTRLRWTPPHLRADDSEQTA